MSDEFVIRNRATNSALDHFLAQMDREELPNPITVYMLADDWLLIELPPPFSERFTCNIDGAKQLIVALQEAIKTVEANKKGDTPK